MGTFVTLSLDKSETQHFEQAFSLLEDVDNSLSSFKPDAVISRLNQNKTVHLDNYSYEALKLSKKYYAQSEGYFDISIGTLTKDIYRFGTQERLVSSELIAATKLGFDTLVFNKDEAQIPKDIKVDLGGMGKGFGVDVVASYLKAYKVKSGIIALSGDIRCLDVCQLEVQSPWREGSLFSLHTKNKDTSISTSGSYNRYIQSQAHNHLINPKTKSSQKNFLSLTLLSSLSNSDLDAYATTASVMPIKKAYTFLKSLELAYIAVEADGSIHISPRIFEFSTYLLMHDRSKQ